MKYIFLILFSFLSLWADMLDDKISLFMTDDKKNLNQKLINFLFENRDDFYKSQYSIDTIKVFNTLLANSLIVKHKFVTDEYIVFKSEGSALIFIKMINDTLKSLGYSEFLVSHVSYEQNAISYEVKVKIKSFLDMSNLQKELYKNGCFVLDIDKEDDKWVYYIDSENIKLIADKLPLINKIKLKKPLRPYFLDVSHAKFIELTSRNYWYPDVVMYDDKLNIIQTYQEKEKRLKRIRLNLPYKTAYIEVSDFYTLFNIKKGLYAYLE